MFYNRGEVFSDQFDHFKLILFWVPEWSFCKKVKENGIKWEFFSQGVGDGGSPILPPIPRLLFFKSVPLNGSSCAWINHHCFSLEGGGRGPLFPLLPSRSGKRTPSELAEPGIVNFKGWPIIIRMTLGTSSKNKKRENVGILKKKNRGRVYPNPTSFVIWQSVFWHAKFILRC